MLSFGNKAVIHIVPVLLHIMSVSKMILVPHPVSEIRVYKFNTRRCKVEINIEKNNNVCIGVNWVFDLFVSTSVFKRFSFSMAVWCYQVYVL